MKSHRAARLTWRMLGLIKAWLEMPVEGDDVARAASAVRTVRAGAGEGLRKGLGQPVLSNLYMRASVLVLEEAGLRPAILRGGRNDYADDVCVSAKPSSAVDAQGCRAAAGLKLPIQRAENPMPAVPGGVV